jgi:hypothetical protein
LNLEGEGIKPTPHEKIRVLEGGNVSIDRVHEWLQDLSALVNSRNAHGLVAKLVSIVPEYWPSEELVAFSELDRGDQSSAYRSVHEVTDSAREVA